MYFSKKLREMFIIEIEIEILIAFRYYLILFFSSNLMCKNSSFKLNKYCVSIYLEFNVYIYNTISISIDSIYIIQYLYQFSQA